MKGKREKRRHRFMSWLCVLVMVAGLINPMALKGSAVEVQAAPAGAIEIDTPEELMKIGKESAYPMSGDYVLTADLDMSGIDYTPIGGIEGTKGAVSGANVFSGTFDGQGHLISNLTIHVEHTYNSANYMQIGMFSVIASSNANDYAVVENIVFANANIYTNIEGGYTAAGTLAGEVNGYATVQNIAILDGSVHVNGFNTSDTVGAGGLVGECRTEGFIGNRNITIKNIFNSAEVIAGSTTENPYSAGIIGRVRGTACKEVSRCVNTGRVSYRGDTGSSIVAVAAGMNTSFVSNCYFLFTMGNPTGNGTIELEEKELKSGVLPTGLDDSVWFAEEGSYPYLQICKNEGAAGYLGLIALSPEFADDENATCVTQDFTLPVSVGDIKVTWTSSNTDVIEIQGTTAKVKSVMAATKVVLTAKTSDGKTRNYTITVLSNTKAEFDQLYAKAGTPLTVTVKNAPADIKYTYTWSVGGQIVSRVTGNSYTPTEADNEKFIKVVVEATNYDAAWEVSMYMSDLPVVYIDTEDGKDVINKDVYKYANVKIQGNDQFSSSSVLYDGLSEIKGRGNSTWDYAASNNLKKPYRLKFDGKADVLGMGKSKHWVLLANTIDHTNMRNELIYEFAEDIGMECVLEFEPCVVVLNGEYRGFYQIGEHKRVDKGRIDIFDWEGLGEDIAAAIADKEGITGNDFDEFEEQVGALDFSWLDTGKITFKGKTYNVADYYKGTIPEFTGGFAFDMDFRLQQSKFISKFYTDYGYPMFFEAPEYAKTSPTMMEFAQTYLQAFENALHDDDFYATYDGEEVHYSELYDIESLLQNWYVVEYTMNWDAMKNSTLMYKDLDTPEGRSLMKMGPVWDFDWAWGNINMYSMTGPWVITGWHTTQDSFCEQQYQRENWNRYLISDPYFAMLAYEKWAEVRAVIEDMIKDGGKIDQLEEYYRDAAVANDAKWSSTYRLYRGIGITNGRETTKQSELYADAVNTMEYFVENRVDWFDTQFTSVENLLSSWGRYKGSEALSVSNVQFLTEGETDITATVTNNNIRKVAFYVNGIRAGEANVANGSATITVADDMLRAGTAGKAMSNCVQIRAMDANGNFLKSGSAVMTNYDIFQKEVAAEGGSEPDVVVDTVVINEVESSDAAGGNDWVELYNKGNEAVDISGWFITDDKGLDRLIAGETTPLPEGTVLEAGAFLVLEENVNFTCGLGSGDTVYLFDAKSNQADVATWTGHAAGTVARVPDGTGEFVDQDPTKGASNASEIGSTDKTALQAAIKAARDLSKADYTEETWTVFEAALEEAIAILNNNNASQEDVDRAAAALKDAQSKLEELPIDDSVVINEVESNDPDDGPDWVEIYNKSDKAVDISGWFITDDKGLDRLPAETTPLPEGIVLKPGEVYVLEEMINFTCGLGSADTVYLYNADKRVVDTCAWAAHAAEGLSRVPDGTGEFADQLTTKGAKNIIPETPGKLEELILLDFTFDDRETGFKGGQAVAQPTGTITQIDGRTALYLNGRNPNWLNVTKEDGSSLLAGIEEMTISYDVRTNGSYWAFYAAPDADAQNFMSEHYIGVMDNNRVLTVERYNSTNQARPAFNTAPIPYGQWAHVEITLSKDSTSIRINDGEPVVQEGLPAITDILGESPILQIGKANWGAGEYFTGYLDNYKITTMVEVEEPKTLPFTDVKEGDWFYEAVYNNYFANLMKGKTETTFVPIENLTRAQFAIILYRMENSPAIAYNAKFPDVPDGDWFTDAVLWAAEKGIVTGYIHSGEFDPHGNITREQAALMMLRYANFKGYDVKTSVDLDSFADGGSVSNYAIEAMKWAVGKGIITGKENGTKIDPQGNTLRAECAVIIDRFMGVYAK